MDLTTVIAGIGAILTAAGGTVLVVREFRHRDHLSANREIEMIGGDLHECRTRLLACSRQIFALRTTLIEHGIDPPEEDE